MPAYFETKEELLEAAPPVPVSLFADWWTKAGESSGTVAARGNNALVTCGEYLGTFSWAAVLEAVNDTRHQLRLPIHHIGYLRKLVAERPNSATLKYLKGPKEQ